tara:strand:- start:1225 stop:2052 length:828 start_codon:yes stop_codon:yes gene_type:complete
MKFKHNKRRNTAFLYEALIKELTKASIRENAEQQKQIVKVLKEFFHKGSTLAQELELYKTLYNTTNIREKQAEKILSEVKKVFLALNRGEIYKQQSRLISRINKGISPSVFNNFVPNYKSIATISQIFNKSAPIKSKIMLEGQIINMMTSRVGNLEESNNAKLNNTTIKLFSKKFNSVYEDLFKEQKELLSKFVSSFKDNGLELKIFLNEELGRLKKELNSATTAQTIKEDTELQKKTKKVLKLLDDFSGQYINENMLKRVLSVQKLVREIKTDG